MTTCMVAGCGKLARSRGLCNAHYQRVLRSGDPGKAETRAIVRGAAEARFWAKVDRRGPDECWLWAGAHSSQGRGNFWDGHAYVKAHRFAWELASGRAVPDGLMVSPQCRTRNCCNPAHLAAVTKHRVIVVTGLTITALNARKKQCDNGHLFTPENTRYKIRTDGRVMRECIACAQEHNRRTVARRSAELRARREGRQS